MTTQTSTIHQFDLEITGLHGPGTIPIRGYQLRAWNAGYAALEMEPADVRRMERAAEQYCGRRDCSCGKARGLDQGPGQTYLIFYSWLPKGEEYEAVKIAGIALRQKAQ